MNLLGELPPSEPKNFIVDRSFAYLIMDEDVILFRGRITDKEPLVLEPVQYL